MTDAASCAIASTCLCGGENLPANGVLEATVTQSFVAQITATFGTTTGFAVGDAICVDQSVVGATILVPVQQDTDAAQVVLPPLDGGTCVPNYANTILLDDAGRPLACNDQNESALALTTPQAVAAMQASSCSASLSALDTRWSESSCADEGAGCNQSGSALHASCVLGVVVIATAIRFSIQRRSARRARRAASR